jgi:hypothetical protein
MQGRRARKVVIASHPHDEKELREREVGWISFLGWLFCWWWRIPGGKLIWLELEYLDGRGSFPLHQPSRPSEGMNISSVLANLAVSTRPHIPPFFLSLLSG